MDMNNIKILTSLKEIESIKSEWNLLSKTNPNRTPYQRWEWNYSWIKGTGQEKSLYILTIKNQKGDLIGIAPFRKKTFLGLFKVLSFIGQETSSYPDFIVQADQAAFVIREFFEYINGCRDIMGLDLKICEPSPSIDILREIPQKAKWRELEVKPYTTRLLVNFGDDYEKYLARLSQKMRKEIRASVKKLNQQFEVGFYASDDSADNFDKRMKALFNLNALRWGGDTLISHPGYREYYRSSRNLDCSRLFTLSCNGVIVGAVGTSLMDDTIFAEIAGFDFSVAKVDLGKVFYSRLFLWAIENHFTKLDFITGLEPYKLSYKPEALSKWKITAYKTKYARTIIDNYQWLSDKIYLIKLRLAKSWLFQNMGIHSFYKMIKRRKFQV
jgi:CelD/BcsL family acetyltransferase involved in cellulose biosynthesis